MRIKVYSCLTLTRADVQRILPGALVASPIERGDLPRDIRRKYNVVVIIDGRFHQALAVSPAEIMDGLRCGMRIYGAASMGALRAAELEGYGMIGCGRIFELVKQDRGFRDDFLGQAFDPATARPRSKALVDITFNLEAMVERGDCDEATAAIISRTLAELHYTDRTLPTLRARLGSRNGNRPALLSAAARAFALGSQKQRDARQVLRRVRSDLESIRRRNAAILWAQRATNGWSGREAGQP